MSSKPVNEFVWHNIEEEGLPPQFQPKYNSKDGHTESVRVLIWDSFYGPSVDALWDGEWISERKSRGCVQPSVCHDIVAWAYIPYPECIDPNMFKKIDKDDNIHY